MTTKLNSSDIAARLLAAENITVVRAPVSTASFDIKSRVLSLPQWKDMTPTMEGMLIGHEVGHALYTTEDYLIPMETNRNLKGYLNVLEDVRIEKLMKRKFPGIRKTMHEGYKELNERDFFGVSKISDMSTLNLIDRINLYFKAGYDCGVSFTTIERDFVNRAEKTETIAEVAELAKEIFEYSKAVIKERKLNIMNSTEEDDNDEEDETDGYESDEDEADIVFVDSDDSELEQSDEPRRARKSSQVRDNIEEQVEKELEAVTEKTFSKNLEVYADESTEYNYYTLDENYAFNPIISYKQVIADTAPIDADLSEYEKKNIQTYKDDSSKVVGYLIKEFEMRKSATSYKRTQVSRIGSLDMKKVWAYKLQDDLFKRVTATQQGKNHGMIFLLDWSGSMDYVLNDTIKQVINLAMFCQRAQIPYQVFAFTTQYDPLTPETSSKMYDIRNQFHYRTDNKLSNASYPFALLEFFSSKMTNVEFNTMIRRLSNFNKLRHVRNGEYSTGGTPLNEALAYMVPYINTFIQKNNVEKMSLITLTDGEGGSLSASDGNNFNDRRYDYKSSKAINCKNFLQDPVTKKNYPINRDGSAQTHSILRLIKDRYNINTIGFYVCSNSRRVLAGAVKHNIPGFEGNFDAMVEIMRTEIRNNGFASLKNTGRDDLFIVPTNKLETNTDELSVNGDQTAKAIARSLTKHMTNKMTSRVLLNKFIGYVA
jgi:hypothetical protein